MNLIQEFYEAVKEGRLTIEQVPAIYRDEVQKLLDGD